MVFSRAQLVAGVADLRRKVLNRLSVSARAQARAAIPSRTLRRSMRTEQKEGRGSSIGTVRLFIPDYWAVYYHDGRGPVRAKPGKKLVFFPDAKDDPRIEGGRPERRSKVRRLSKRQFQRFLEINRQRKAAGREPIMIVTDAVGPAAGTHFFTRGMKGFDKKAGDIVVAEVRKLVADLGLTAYEQDLSVRLDL